MITTYLICEECHWRIRWIDLEDDNPLLMPYRKIGKDTPILPQSARRCLQCGALAVHLCGDYRIDKNGERPEPLPDYEGDKNNAK